MRRIAVRAIIADGDKLLLVRHKPYHNKPASEFFCTVGGGLDLSESLIEGIKREVLEETGVEAVVGKLIFVQQYRERQMGQDVIEFFFHITNTKDFENIDLGSSSHGDEEIEEVGFYNPKEISVLPEFLREVDIQKALAEPEAIIFNYL